ncbi:MAG: hypothetical protein ABSG81_11665 [Acidimicrobiales bacterium]
MAMEGGDGDGEQDGDDEQNHHQFDQGEAGLSRSLSTGLSHTGLAQVRELGLEHGLPP